jgi:hypothetical protein
MAARKKKTSRNTARPWMEVDAPATRALRVYAQDPSTGSYSGNRMTLNVPWEPLAPGPTGRKVAVIDYDATNECYYMPVNLDDPMLLARGGVDPSESDPRFHQQMVYAVACRTIEMFEVALGRNIHWRRAGRPGVADTRRESEDIWVLKLYPHAMQQANAYYSPQAHGILFGYFTANEKDQGRNLPGQRIFTCLSHDIIAHEVTHAVIDGIRNHFTEPTNPDVLAFHEGFADLCALFSHFSQEEALIDAIQRTGGRLYDAALAPASGPLVRAGDTPVIAGQVPNVNPLIQLALQFGEARGAGKGLRSALGTPPNSDNIHVRVDDPHFRGSILVAAVFDAFFNVYLQRSADLFRIYDAGGANRTDDLPGPLAKHLARHASETATFFFQLCARSLDYCPPVDITFGDFLRALITVAMEIEPNDRHNVRDALMEAFRLRGIYPESASFYSEDALAWPLVAEGTLPAVDRVPTIDHETGREKLRGLVFGSPNGLTKNEDDINGQVLHTWAEAHRKLLGLDPTLPVSVPSFHPVFHKMANGRMQVQMVVQVIQSKTVDFDADVPQGGSFPFRGGVTLIIAAPELIPGKHSGGVATPPKVRFMIGKAISGKEGQRREKAQRQFAISQGLALGDTEDPTHFQANFGLLHEER